MSVNVFISYSHKDEKYKESLEEHLSGLRRKGVIDDWNDRKIVAGQDWSNKIENSLETSSVVLFLVSSSFLASDYCMGIEAERAMEMHQENRAILIPIIVRPCDWMEAEFSQFQGLPKDAVPVSSWSSEDEAWLDVINGIKKSLVEFHEKKTEESVAVIKDQVSSINEKTLKWLDDTEIVLTHRKVDRVSLSDIYVYPDVSFLDNSVLTDSDFTNSKHVFKEKGWYLVSGEEQQGKTSLLKQGYLKLLKDSVLPLYLDAKVIKKSNVEFVIKKALYEQYEGLDYKCFMGSENRCLLLDNVDEIGLNSRFRDLFVSDLSDSFDWIVVTCHESFNYILSDINTLCEFEELGLLEFGNFKREELVKKWISLGVEESIEDSELYSKSEDLKSHLNTVIKKNVVPARPIYVLMLVQMYEAYAQQNLDLTSYGHCYQQLIYKSFENAGVHPRDYDKYLNVLTELSWRIFVNEGGLNKEGVDVFFVDYGKKYLSVDKGVVLDKLVSHSILSNKSFLLEFKYPYIYYFFVGKKIAESYASSEESRSTVERLLNGMHREDFANIIIFITHHTKDSWVLDKIREVLSGLYEDRDPAALTREQLGFMGEFIKKIPNIVIEQREIQKERDDYNRRLDQIEDIPDDQESPEILSNINKTFKGMEVAGQIIRNRHAILTRDSLFDLANSGISTGLRFLDYFINISDTAKSEIVKLICEQLVEHPRISDQEIQAHAENTYLHLTYGVINGVVRKIASSVGSKEAYEIYEALEVSKNTPAHTLIKQSIELQFKRVLDVSSVEKTMHALKNNPVCLRILKEMVVQHIYMFPVDYKSKQKLAELLEISIRGQRLMEQRKVGK